MAYSVTFGTKATQDQTASSPVKLALPVYQLMRSEMSSSTGESTIQNKYHSSDVTTATPNSQPVPYRVERPWEAMIQGYLSLSFCLGHRIINVAWGCSHCHYSPLIQHPSETSSSSSWDHTSPGLSLPRPALSSGI